ncbi:MAG: hypothetical protein RLZZ324_249 [Candidatus Parcubacteria bacterium]|jgi:hypothetical protein
MLKDQVLESLASQGANIAQFASYGPDGLQRHSRIRGFPAGHAFASTADAIRAIHATQAAPNVNIRTFLTDKTDGNPFLYGPKHGFHDAAKAASAAQEQIAKGYFVIINETIDESDGGFSGVLYGDLFEFASRDIPRCVEKPGCAALPRALASALIRVVHRFDLRVPFASDFRVECSVHPIRVGYLGEQQIIWQAERLPGAAIPAVPQIRWPNRYSRDMGDKAFGLLIAHLLGFRVPRTRVFGRTIPFFDFGQETGNGGETWLRTCPTEQQPGLYTTMRGWCDPYALMQREDPTGSAIAAVIVQDGVRAAYAGAAVTAADGSLICEGRAGFGDGFMQGEGTQQLPDAVLSAVESVWQALRTVLGDVRFEWVFDGTDVWVVQLHVGRTVSSGTVICPGEPAVWRDFDVLLGLEALRALIADAVKDGFGIRLHGDVGLTSHLGDLLRRNAVPSVIVRR